MREARDLLVDLIDAAGERAADELRDDLVARVAGQVAVERAAVGEVLVRPGPRRGRRVAAASAARRAEGTDVTQTIGSTLHGDDTAALTARVDALGPCAGRSAVPVWHRPW